MKNMKNEKNYTIDVSNLIALCHIVNEYEEFEKSLLAYISPKYNRDFVAQLFEVTCEGKVKLGAKKAKKFYNENKEIIDIINQYSNISKFINLNYGFHGEPNEDFQVIYKYIFSHKDEVDKILIVLQKISELGFDRLRFNEHLDFTNEIYSVPSDFWRIYHFTYVANAQMIPNYYDDINYKTLNSNYKIKLERFFGEEFDTFGKEIIVNSLLFDPNTLPIKLDRENTFEKFAKVKEEQKSKTVMIRNSVDLGISILDLDSQLSLTSKTVTRLEDLNNKEELVAVLSRIKTDLEQLKELSVQYDNSIASEQSTITLETLKKEKELYLKYREWSKIDLD